MIWILHFFISIAYGSTAIQGIPSTIDSLDPFSIAGIDAYTITANVIEPLARSNPRTGEIIPVLAKSWTLDSKSKTFKVKLREKVQFHNGQALTADDVKFTLEAYFKPEYKGQIWQGMWADIESIKVLDPLTVEFKMKNWRYQTFESVLTSLRILPKSFYYPAEPEKFRKNIVGTGPFKLKKFTSGRRLEFEPFEQWWGPDKPKHNLLIKSVTTPSLAAEMMNKQQLDFYALGAVKPPNSKFIRTFKSGLGSGLWIDLNMKNPLFQDPIVRECLDLLWQRGKVNLKIFGGSMQLAASIFSPTTDIHNHLSLLRDDPPEAVRILKREGWSDLDKDGVLDKNGKKFEFTVLVNSAEQERWLTFFQNDAKAAGILVHIFRLEDDGQWLKRQKEGRFDAVARTGGLINEPTAVAWHTGAPYNYQSFSDPEVDKLTDELEGEFELKKRRLILGKAIARICEMRPFVPGFYSQDEVFLVSRKLEPLSEFPARAWSWKLH